MGNMVKQLLEMMGASMVRGGKGPQPCERGVAHSANEN